MQLRMIFANASNQHARKAKITIAKQYQSMYNLSLANLSKEKETKSHIQLQLENNIYIYFKEIE